METKLQPNSESAFSEDKESHYSLWCLSFTMKKKKVGTWKVTTKHALAVRKNRKMKSYRIKE